MNKKAHINTMTGTMHTLTWGLSVLALLMVLALAACHRDKSRDAEPHKNGARSFCNNPYDWASWHDLYELYKFDDEIVALYSMRIGLCTMVMQDRITPERADQLVQKRYKAAMQHLEETWVPILQELERAKEQAKAANNTANGERKKAQEAPPDTERAARPGDAE